MVTGSGMAAATLALHALLPRGGRVVVPHDCYGGCWRLFDALSRKGQFTVATADLTDARSLADALREPTDLVWIETPSNPLLRITDLRFVIDATHAAGALAVVDNTFLSPALQQPISFGADVVVHSTTKYINGHSDVVGGAVVAKDVDVHEQLAWWANCLGITGAPFDSFLTLRGLRTLGARLRVHQENTVALAGLFDGHPAVRAVHYPGLASHPGHAIAARQQTASSLALAKSTMERWEALRKKDAVSQQELIVLRFGMREPLLKTRRRMAKHRIEIFEGPSRCVPLQQLLRP